jgi:hypothetical protein
LQLDTPKPDPLESGREKNKWSTVLVWLHPQMPSMIGIPYKSTFSTFQNAFWSLIFFLCVIEPYNNQCLELDMMDQLSLVVRRKVYMLINFPNTTKHLGLTVRTNILLHTCCLHSLFYCLLQKVSNTKSG